MNTILTILVFGDILSRIPRKYSMSHHSLFGFILCKGHFAIYWSWYLYFYFESKLCCCLQLLCDLLPGRKCKHIRTILTPIPFITGTTCIYLSRNLLYSVNPLSFNTTNPKQQSKINNKARNEHKNTKIKHRNMNQFYKN